LVRFKLELVDGKAHWHAPVLVCRYASTFLEMDVRIRSLENDLDGYNELQVKDKVRGYHHVGCATGGAR
jgi:hypothetical protein